MWIPFSISSNLLVNPSNPRRLPLPGSTNALDNIRELNKLLGAVEANVLLAGEHPADVAKRAVNDIDDAIMVLQEGGLHPDAVQRLREARGLTEKAATSPSSRIKLAKQALDAINQAKSLILG